MAAIIGALTLYSCCCTLYNSLAVCFCDRDTLKRSYFVASVISNSISSIILVFIALALNGHDLTTAFTRETYILGFIVTLAFAYPLWLYVPESEESARVEPIAPSNAANAVVDAVQSLAKNKCAFTLLPC